MIKAKYKSLLGMKYIYICHSNESLKLIAVFLNEDPALSRQIFLQFLLSNCIPMIRSTEGVAVLSYGK